MAGGKLEVQIGADITDFEKKIKEVEYDIKELSKVKLDRLKVGLDTTEINAQIKDAKNNLTQLKTAVKDTGGQISGQFTKQVGNGNNALLQFSRIAQDAPFGIIGIGNNLTATAESFSYLKQQTGSTGGALKALASSIAGTGGILLGVSLLTTGLTLLAQSGLSVQDVIDKVTGKFDEFGASLNKIAVESAKVSAQEIAGLNALVSVAQDDVKSRKERLIAVEELQDKYPAYFGNLDKEKILNGDLTTVTKELTKAIIARAEATALSDKIGELASKKLDLEIKKEKALLKLKQAQASLDNSVNVGGGSLVGGNIGATSVSAYAKFSRATETVKDLNKEIADIQKLQNDLADRLNQKTSESIGLLEKKAKVVKAKNVFDTPQVSGIPQLLVPAPLVDVNTIKTFNGQIDALGNKVKELPGTIKASMLQASTEADLGAIRLAIALNDFNVRAGEIIQGAIADTFAGLGSAIGDALANGGSVLQAVGVSLLDSLGSLLTDMGKMAIQVGVGLLAIKVALKSLNPAVAIGAGVALVALGSFFSSKSRSLSNSIGGGGTSAATGSGANNTSFTSGGFTSRGDGGGTVVFEIAGQKLIGVLSNTLNANRRLGGSLGI